MYDGRVQRSRQRDDLRELQDADGAATHYFAVWEIALSPATSREPAVYCT